MGCARMCMRKMKTFNIFSSRRKRLKLKRLIMLCAGLLCVFITVSQIKLGAHERLNLDDTHPRTELDRQLRARDNSLNENTSTRVDIRTAINTEEKSYGKVNYDFKLHMANSLKDASDVSKASQESDELDDTEVIHQTMPPRAKVKVFSHKKAEENTKTKALIDNYAKDNDFGQAPELKKDTEFDQSLEFNEDSEFDQALELKEDQFQNITEDGNYVVYNAYIDGPEKRWVRAVGFSRHLSPRVNLHCLFWDPNMNAISMTTNVTIQILPFHTIER